MKLSDKINLVKESPMVANILRVCGVEQRGKKWQCPFHDDVTPSLVVHGDDTWWKCYGCNKTGSVIDLVMHFYSVEFKQAVEMLYSGMNHPGWTMEVLERLNIKDKRDERKHQTDVCRMVYNAVINCGYELRLGRSETHDAVEKIFEQADYHQRRADEEKFCPPAAYFGLMWDYHRIGLIAAEKPFAPAPADFDIWDSLL